MARDGLRFLDLEDLPLSLYSPKSILDKERGAKHYINYMLDRTTQMFEYTGLPATIPAYQLELYLQTFGYASFVNVTEENAKQGTLPGLYVFFGGVGGERDIYYRPTKFIVSNHRLRTSVNCNIVYSEDQVQLTESPCVIMRNDTNYMGLTPLYSRYAAQMVENDISIRSAQINARAQVAVSASTDNDLESARKYLDDLEAGKIGLIGSQPFLNGIDFHNVGTAAPNTIIQLIELQQYLKASWFNELGLNVNFNMKREYMSAQEIAVNTDVLLPLIDDMLTCRERAVSLINSVFGTSISVRKSSAWANKAREEEAAIKKAEAEAGEGMEGEHNDEFVVSPEEPDEPDA